MNIFGWVGLFIAGWMGGSFINLLSDQLVLEDRRKRLLCPKCRKPITIWHYIFLRPCLACKSKASIRSVIVLIVITLVTFVLWYFPHNRLPFLAAWILLLLFSLVTIIDLEHRLILGPVSLVGTMIGFAAGYLLHGWQITLAGGAAGAAIMLMIYWLGRLFSAWMVKRQDTPVDAEALGFGDVYVAGIIGLVLGWPGITAGLILGILMGGGVSGLILLIMLILRRYQPFLALPYAPFLLAAALFLLFRPVIQ